MITISPVGQAIKAGATSTVTSGSLEEDLAEDDLRHKIPKALSSDDSKPRNRPRSKPRQQGDGVFNGAELEYMEMTEEERKEYLKTAKPAGWNLEFEAQGGHEDDIPLQIHWQDCQESLDDEVW